MRSLDGAAMRSAAARLIGEHDFSSFRASACQAKSPVKTMRRITVTQKDVSPDGERCQWHFEFEADAFLHHMIRNIMGCLVRIGHGDERPEWIAEVLAARSRKVAAPTFSPAGLYFVGPLYDAVWGLPAEATLGASIAAYDGPP
jgi:tRNA pseudouridine38-40 synthase